jgi:uncharacterized membrane protein
VQSNGSPNRYIYTNLNNDTGNNHMNVKTLLGTSLLSASALLSANALAVPDAPAQWEKCSGIAKAGQNNCGALDGSHSCSGQAKTDNMEHEWVYVPEGTCERISGGKVRAVKPAKSQ